MMKNITTLFFAFLLCTFFNHKTLGQQFSIGSTFSTALCDGKLYTTGTDLGSYGVLGMGASNNQLLDYTQINFNFGASIKKVVSQGYTTLVLLQNGEVWAYGANSNGQLGIGNTINQNIPVRVFGVNNTGFLSNIEDIDLDDLGTTALALDSQGRVIGWGLAPWLSSNTNNIPSYIINSINQLPLNDIVQLSTSWGASLALDSLGNVWTWGRDSNYGCLGLGTLNTIQQTAIQIPNLSNIIKISQGLAFSLALKIDGTLWSWGSNGSGTLGDGTFTNRNTPVQVIDPAAGNGFLQNVKDITAGYYHVFVIKVDDSLWSWGSNSNGALGNISILNGGTNIPNQCQDSNGFLLDIEKVYTGGNATVIKQKVGRNCRFLSIGDRQFNKVGSNFTNYTGIPEEMSVQQLNCCGIKSINSSFQNFQANRTTICPNTCVEIVANVAFGNPTVDNWIVYGASSISNTSGLTTEVCFDTPGVYNVFAQINGSANIVQTGIQISVLPENSKACNFDTNDDDYDGTRLSNDINVTIYPNPSFSIFNIETKNVTNFSYKVNNIFGKTILSNSVKNTNTIKIDLSKREKGIYFLIVTTEKGDKTFKLIKS